MSGLILSFYPIATNGLNGISGDTEKPSFPILEWMAVALEVVKWPVPRNPLKGYCRSQTCFNLRHRVEPGCGDAISRRGDTFRVPGEISGREKSKLAGRKAWKMVKKDLKRVGIPYRNADCVADFHTSCRRTHITELLRNGATLPEAMNLALHSSVQMTMKYCHVGLDDQAKALASLPAPVSGSCQDMVRKPAVSSRQEMALRCRIAMPTVHKKTSLKARFLAPSVSDSQSPAPMGT